QFVNTQTEAAFGLVGNSPGTATFTALLNGSVVESFSAGVGVFSLFYGFTDSLFDEIQVELNLSLNAPSIFDNIQFGHTDSPTTPEPAALLSLLALVFCDAMTRKRE
ncbi:MAG: hypothetical protein AAGG02_13135, partial [Cyanobacteria bacterium P01_H01_bin.15]